MDKNKVNKKEETLHIGFDMPCLVSPNNWTDDYKNEENQYICKCSKCGDYSNGIKEELYVDNVLNKFCITDLL